MWALNNKPNMTRLLCLFSLIILCVLPISASAQQSSRIAAVVNEDVISLYDVQARIAFFLSSSGIPDTPQNRQRLVPQIINSLIDERLKIQEARELELDVTQAEIQNSVSRVEAQNGLESGGFTEFMQQQGIDPQTAYTQFEADIAWFKVVRSSLAQDIVVTEEEVEIVMDRMIANLGKPEHRVAEIYLQINDFASASDVRDLAFRLTEQARENAPFDALARQFSQSPTAAIGGDLGWIHEGELENALDREVRRMEPGDVSDPIRVAGGYYVIRLNDRRDTSQVSPLQSIITLSQLVLLTDGPRAVSDARLAQLRDAIDSQVVNCDQMNEWAQEVGGPASGPIGRLRVGSYPPLVRDAIVALPVNEVSAPIQTNGAEIFVMICTREDDSGMPDENQIYSRLENEKLSNMARQRLRDLRRQALVEVRL